MSYSSHNILHQNRNQMNSARTVTRTRPATAATAATAIQTRKTITARAFAKALQIEAGDSARNRTMWNRLKSSIQ